MKQFFELGRILRPHGIKGELKAELYSDDADRAYTLEHVFVGGERERDRYKVKGARTDGRFAYLALDGVTDRDAAEKLRGETLYIDRAHAAPIPEGAFYISDLIGLEVQTDNGETLGILVDILQNGAKDVYRVQRIDGSEFMFPAVDDVFVKRNPEEGRIVVSASRFQEVAVL